MTPPTDEEFTAALEQLRKQPGALSCDTYEPEHAEDVLTALQDYREIQARVRELSGQPSIGQLRDVSKSSQPPRWWKEHSTQLWSNYRYLQEAALTILGEPGPIQLEDVEAKLETIRATEVETGERLMLVYPRKHGNGFGPCPLLVYRGKDGDQRLSRIADFAQRIVSDLHCWTLDAAAYLLCDYQRELPWVTATVDKRQWTKGAKEQLRVAGVPSHAAFPPGDEDLIINLRIGSVKATQGQVAAAYQAAKQEVERRFAGKPWEQVVWELMLEPLDFSQATSGPGDTPPRRGQRGATLQLVRFVDARLGRMEWQQIFAEWQATDQGGRYKNLRSMQMRYYDARKAGGQDGQS